MAPQTLDGPGGLLPHIREKGLVPRVHRAGEHEILPHHDARLVAEIVEEIVFVDAAAPDPQHVHVRRRRVPDEALVTLQFDTTGEGVERHPVRPLHEDRNPVHLETEGLSIAVRFCYEPGFPYPGPLVGHVDDAAVGGKLDDQVVEVLPSVPSRPPEPGLTDREADLDTVRARLNILSNRREDAAAPLESLALDDGDRRVESAQGLHHDDRREIRLSRRYLFLLYAYRLYSRAAPRLESHRTPDAAGHEPRRPVPTVLIGGLPREDARAAGELVTERFPPLPDLPHGRTEQNTELVPPFPQETRAVDAPLPEHVVGLE